ncbi:hypothetical protein PL373_09330 [Tenacibaculum maritimum]|nr:hypothetical protein [Tenacibaculum maritimum]MDB0601346.1 hypothetical protein [Tenacibaculum maritimum]MDB0611767.1 hypothetical protein [Tenacibaculum maritimum]
MEIQLLENGKVILSENNEIHSILSDVFFHKHPRNAAAILITSTVKPDESEGISLETITMKGRKLPANKFLTIVADTAVNGSGDSTENPIQEIYKGYAQIIDFETMVTFMENLKNRSKSVTKNGDKINTIEYGYNADGIKLTIVLKYFYKNNDQNKIDYIEMKRTHSVSSTVSNGLNISDFKQLVKQYNHVENSVTYSYITVQDLHYRLKADFGFMNTYEQILTFVSTHQFNIGGEKHQDGKLVEKEYYCQFQTLSLRVTLRYYYKHSGLISHILMSGTTNGLENPTKVYRYNNAGEIIGYYYTGIGFTTSQANDPLA